MPSAPKRWERREMESRSGFAAWEPLPDKEDEERAGPSWAAILPSSESGAAACGFCAERGGPRAALGVASCGMEVGGALNGREG